MHIQPGLHTEVHIQPGYLAVWYIPARVPNSVVYPSPGYTCGVIPARVTPAELYLPGYQQRCTYSPGTNSGVHTARVPPNVGSMEDPSPVNVGSMEDPSPVNVGSMEDSSPVNVGIGPAPSLLTWVYALLLAS